ncbi:MAG: DUF167 family protein [Candidatus Paceibacterota bacterium]
MLFHVKIEPESKEDSVTKKNETSYIVKVRDEAKENKANYKMLSLLARYFKIEKNKLRIITGHHSPSKILEILENKEK